MDLLSELEDSPQPTLSNSLVPRLLRHPADQVLRLERLLETVINEPDGTWRDLLLSRGFPDFGRTKVRLDIAGQGESGLSPLLRMVGQYPAVNTPGDLPDGKWHESWHILRAIETFAASPTREALGDALEEIAGHDLTPPWPRYAFGSAPWPLGTCLEWSRDKEDILHLSRSARQGELGDVDAWLDAERRWVSEGIRQEDVTHSSCLSAPYDRDIGRVGFPLTTGRWEWMMGTEVDTQRTTSMVQTWFDEAPEPRVRAQLASLLLFAAAVWVGHASPRSSWSLRNDTFEALVAQLDEDDGYFLCAVLNRLDLSGKAPTISVEALDRYGRLRPARSGVRIRSDVVLALTTLVQQEPQCSGLWRLLALAALDQESDEFPAGFELPPEPWPAPEASVILRLLWGCGPPVKAAEVLSAAGADPHWAILLLDALPRTTRHYDFEDLIIGINHDALYGDPPRSLDVEPLMTNRLLQRTSALQEPEEWKRLHLFARR